MVHLSRTSIGPVDAVLKMCASGEKWPSGFCRSVDGYGKHVPPRGFTVFINQ
jgi:hypothetical protein